MNVSIEEGKLLCHGGKVQQLLFLSNVCFCAVPMQTDSHSGTRGTLANPVKSCPDHNRWQRRKTLHSLLSWVASRQSLFYGNPEISVPKSERRHLFFLLNVHQIYRIWLSLNFCFERRRNLQQTVVLQEVRISRYNLNSWQKNKGIDLAFKRPSRRIAASALSPSLSEVCVRGPAEGGRWEIAVPVVWCSDSCIEGERRQEKLAEHNVLSFTPLPRRCQDTNGPPALSDISEDPLTPECFGNTLTYLATQVNLSLSWKIEM